MGRPTYMLVLVLGVLLYLESTDACSCLPVTARQSFCDTDYVIEVRIVNESAPIYPDGVSDYVKDMYAEYEYGFEILNVLRSTEAFESARKIIRNHGSGSLCGVRLVPGHRYYIAGYAGEHLSFGLCSFFVDMDGMWYESRKTQATAMMANPLDCSIPQTHEPYFKVYMDRPRNK